MMVLLTALVTNATKSAPSAVLDQPPAILAAITPGTPAALPVTPVKPARPVVIFSPIPTMSAELHACLADFERVKGIDLYEIESSLAFLEITPEVVANMPMARLVELTGALKGRLRKFQIFCEKWVERLEEKKCAYRK